MMLGGGCSKCCGRCGCKRSALLPYTMTVTFSGLKNETHGKYCDLTISSEVGGGDEYGCSAAKGVAVSPGGCDFYYGEVCCKWEKKDPEEPCLGENKTLECKDSDRGPLTKVLLTEPGSGYFVYRSEPTLEVSGGSGEGAEFEVTLEKFKCSWSVESISVTGGEGYLDNDSLIITPSEDDTTLEEASANLRTAREEPSITAYAEGGYGASLSVTLTKAGDDPPQWSVSSVEVDDGGFEYVDGSPVTFVLGERDFGQGASATIRTNRTEPALSALATGSGEGASLFVSVAPFQDWDGSQSWQVTGVGVLAAGTGYSQFDYVSIEVTDGQEVWGAYAYVESVDENGGVVGVAVQYGGSYYKGGGTIQSVNVTEGGLYYHDTGVPSEVEVVSGGKYYKYDPAAEPCASVSVEPCGGGYDAKITPVIDSDKTSPTFGQITDLTIEEGGDYYLVWNWVETCREQLNGIPYVLRAKSPEPLVHLEIKSCFSTSCAVAHVEAVGERVQPDICIRGSGKEGSIVPTLEEQYEDEESPCPIPYWVLSSVAASGGYGYTDGEAAYIDYNGATVEEYAGVTLHATGITEEDPPNDKNDGVLTGATVGAAGKFYIEYEWDGLPTPIKKVVLDWGGGGYARYGREEPVLEFVGRAGGYGADFTPTFLQEQDECGLDYWTIDSISVSGEGSSEYEDGTPLGIDLASSNDKEDSPAEATIYTREIPLVEVSVMGTAGTGAKFEYALVKSETLPRTWTLDALALTAGGSGYPPGQSVALSFDPGPQGVAISAAAAVASVDQNGVISSVEVVSEGVYYRDRGRAVEVEVADGGVYYRENTSLPPYVADVEVAVTQTLPSAGSGLEIVAVVDEDTGSPTFGQITKLVLENCGSGYLPLGGPLDCEYEGPCDITLRFRGKGQKAELKINDANGATFRTDQPLDDCESLPPSASVFHSIGEGTAAIVAGGAWDSLKVCPCKDSTNCTPLDSTACDSPFEDPQCRYVTAPCPPCVGYCDECNECPCGCRCVEGVCEPICGPCESDAECGKRGKCVDGKCLLVSGYSGNINWLVGGFFECFQRPFEIVGPNGTCVDYTGWQPNPEPCDPDVVGLFDTLEECQGAVDAAVQAVLAANPDGFCDHQTWCTFLSCDTGNPLP